MAFKTIGRLMTAKLISVAWTSPQSYFLLRATLRVVQVMLCTMPGVVIAIGTNHRYVYLYNSLTVNNKVVFSLHKVILWAGLHSSHLPSWLFFKQAKHTLACACALLSPVSILPSCAWLP